MKKLIILFLINICAFQLNSQDTLKEITKTFENGQPMFIDYLEIEDLKKVKTEIFNETGTLIFSVQYNKNTGKYDGDFYDLINKGYFKDGVLNCNNCMLVEANKPSVFTYNHDRQNTLVTKGNVVDGRLTGKVERYTLTEGTYARTDWESTRKYVAAGAGSGFRDVKTYRTGQFTKYQLPTYNYNSNGVLDGEVISTYGNRNTEIHRQKLNFENGIVKSMVTYDKNNLIIDSLFNENRIWKINKRFVKNDGFLVFSGLPENASEDYINLNFFRSKELISTWERFEGGNGYKFEDRFSASDNNGIIALGGSHTYSWEEYISRNIYTRGETIETGGPKLGLDANGIYSISLEGMFDNIIYYDLGTMNYGNEPYMYYAGQSSREKNLFVLIYNYLINGMDDNLLRKFYSYDYSESGVSLVTFVEALKSDHYLEQKNPLALRKNSFKKYIKLKGERLPWVRESDKSRSYITLSSFFTNIISMTDYLRACKESIDNNETEIQYLMVWNTIDKKYDKVQFDKLIELSIQQEAKLNAETKLKDEKNNKASENLKLFTSTEKSSDVYSDDYSIAIKNLSSYYGLSIIKMEGYVDSENSEQLFYYYFNDLGSLSKMNEIVEKQRDVKVHSKNENDLLLVVARE